MCKKILSQIMVCILLLSMVLPVCADEKEVSQERFVTIINTGSLKKLAEDCRLDSYSQNLVVSLKADLDLTDSEFDGFPIFCGRFEGNGHTIRGLELTQEGSVQGFFRYLTESAVVNDLHLQGSVQPAGSAGMVGGFVGENSGHIRGCSFTGTVSGNEYIGGIAGVSTVTGVIENCHTSGNVFGGHFVGGIAGKNAGTIRLCENHGAVNETSRKNQVELTDITLDMVIHSEAANTVTDVGGIAGNSTGVIRDCINHARIGYPSMGYNVGGIAGTQSGSIINCENRGEVFGRKEVGGIVGQMEPCSVMVFEEDVLQILGKQLDGLGNSVSKASSNLQGAGEKILDKMGGMFDYIGAAQDAIGSLIPDQENPQLPDLDAIQAAKNNIGSSLTGMTNLMQGVSATAYSALGKVTANLHEISNQINAIRVTLDNISETTGGTVVDRSDEDTEEDLSGKVSQCRNTGDVHGDLNCGGIAGAIALENDLDVQEDWITSGKNSLNFESALRAVILNCENSGSILADKENVGGIVGFQSLGLVKKSSNTGKLEAEMANHVGGISGRSHGFIRNCYTKGEIWGGTYVGGVAGSAAVATDCCTLVQIAKGVEKIGAILGSKEDNRAKVEEPIAGNYYLAFQEDPGAIDGISFEGLAQPLGEEAFFLLEELPEIFRSVQVKFVYGNGMERKFTVKLGGPFPEKWIPAIPQKDGRRSYWGGLENADLSGIFFDVVFEQEYTTQTTVLESTLERNGIPLLFVQGDFSEEAVLSVQSIEAHLSLEKQEELLEIWEFHTTESSGQTQIRLQVPGETNSENLRIRIRGSDGSWREENHSILGRYAVASLTSGDDAIALVQTSDSSWLMILGLALVCVIALGFVFVSRKRKRQS